MEETRPRLAPETTINELLALDPDALPLLNDLGIDTCCGGSMSLREAAEEAGLSLHQVLDTLRGVSG